MESKYGPLYDILCSHLSIDTDCSPSPFEIEKKDIRKKELSVLLTTEYSLIRHKIDKLKQNTIFFTSRLNNEGYKFVNAKKINNHVIRIKLRFIE